MSKHQIITSITIEELEEEIWVVYDREPYKGELDRLSSELEEKINMLIHEVIQDLRF